MGLIEIEKIVTDDKLVVKRLFLEAIKAFMNNRTVQWDRELSEQEWSELYRLAREQKVLPMVYASVYECNALQNSAVSGEKNIRMQMQHQVVYQVMKNEEFLKLYAALAEQGLQPIVVKGIICRELYHHPDYRISGDEDLYIPPGTWQEYHKALLDAGMEPVGVSDPELQYEITYVKKGGILRIELHKTLFETESQVYAGINEPFAEAFEHSIFVEVEGVPVRTMGHTDHFLFLVLHAFKHFVNSGFGIRQVCDIIMYAATYGNLIDWHYVYDECEKMRVQVFTAALFDIGYRYFDFHPDQVPLPEKWRHPSVDSGDLLDDLLSAGIYGSSSMSRKHSCNVTLNAVSAEKQGKKRTNAVLKSIFLPAKSLEMRYPYLQRYPFLLPVAWMHRILRYRKEIKEGNRDNDALESLKIGNQRVELMKKYNII